MQDPAQHPDVVFLGADIGVYTMARAYHLATGKGSTVVASNALAAVRTSSLVTMVPLASVFDEDAIVATLLSLREGKTEPAILMTNSDHFAAIMARHAAALERSYVIPQPRLDVMERIADKDTFMSDCIALGVAVPRGITVDLAAPDFTEPSLESFTFPVIAKPANSAQYVAARFEGKKKIYLLNTAAEVSALWSTLRSVNYPGEFLLQEYIPGGDDAIRSVTAYVDASGAVTLLCAAQVLLEECVPHKLGIPSAMLTMADEELFTAVRTYLESVDYRGFANADAKIDPRTGKAVLFEINTRIGRNNFYVTAAGANVMEAVLDDVAGRHGGEPRLPQRTVLYTTVPPALLKRYVTDPALWATVKRAMAQGVARPMHYSGDRSALQRVHAWLLELAQWRSYARYRPAPAKR